MNLERAREINDACIAHLMGLNDDPPPIDQYSLRDMLEAREVIRRHETIDKARLPPGVGQTIRVVCDPRLIAALYVACHYQAEPPDDCEPIVMVGTTAVVVVRVETPPPDPQRGASSAANNPQP